MFINITQQEHKDRFDRVHKCDIIRLKCDMCGKEWETRGSKTRIMSRKTHMCSEQCKRTAHKNGGVIERQRAKTNVARYGAENTFAAESCKQKITNTLIERHGVKHALQSSIFLEKFKRTMIERFGVESPSQSSEIQAKQVATMQRNWGVSYPMQLQHVRDAMMSGTIAKYGVPHHMQNKEHAYEVFQKRASEGTLFISKPEQLFYEKLCEKFGVNDIDRQVVMNKRWSIDFYVKTIDTYVQFDGVYWHGLDRPIELIHESGKSGHRRDMSIYRKWLVDRQQDKWFELNNLRLVRVTDNDFKRSLENCLLMIQNGTTFYHTSRDELLF